MQDSPVVIAAKSVGRIAERLAKVGISPNRIAVTFSGGVEVYVNDLAEAAAFELGLPLRASVGSVDHKVDRFVGRFDGVHVALYAPVSEVAAS